MSELTGERESAVGSRRSVLRAVAGVGAAAVGGPLLAGEAAADDRDCPPPLRFAGAYGNWTDETAHSAVETPDGGFLAGGTREPLSGAPSSALLVSVDAAGDVEWTREYGGEGVDAVRSLARADGGYGCVGATGSFGAAESDAWLFEVDADGRVAWSETYGGSGSDAAQSGVRTADGGYALGGQTTSPELVSYDADEFDEYGDALLVKTDGSGRREFARAYSTEPRSSEYANAVVQTADAGYALLGAVHPRRGRVAPTLIKTTESGDAEWTRRYDGYGLANAVVQTADGGYAIAGDSTAAAPGAAYLLKADASGEVTWSRTYGVDRPHTYTEAEGLVRTRGGGYAFVGRKTRLEGNLDPADDVEATVFTDARLVKTDAAGRVEWTDVYDVNGTEWPRSLVETRDGGYAFAGATGGVGKEDPNVPDDDFLLAKVGGDGGD